MTREPLDPQKFDEQELAKIIGRYILDEISLGKAAEEVGLTRWEMEDLLRSKGVEVRYGSESRMELSEEIENALELEK